MSRALVLTALLRSTAALLVTQGSQCAPKCGNVPTTTDDQIVCDESAYGTSNGAVFESCVNCESTSSYVTTIGTQEVSDLQAMLYNMRYTTNKCLFQKQGVCATSFACENIMEAIQYGNLSSSVSAYGYCSQWTDFRLDKCSGCLLAAGEHYLNNFVSILSGACRLLLQPPATIPLDGAIFSTTLVNVTDPSATATYTPSATDPLGYGGIAGVVIGGIVFLLMLIGCGVVVNGKRRRKAYLRRREEHVKNWPNPNGGGGPNGEMFETPTSQRPLRGWEDSPISAATQTTFPPYFSPYASQYNSPVSAVEGAGPSQSAWPSVEKARNVGVALSPDRDASFTHWGDGKGKERADTDQGMMHTESDEYELQEGVNSAGGYAFPLPPPPPLPAQAPTLSHPGLPGRHGPALQPQRNQSWSGHHDGGNEGM
ncbi:Uu.00g087090.m01.CDS01 [Anthostomella pinea]|uniref:Uu.00g087090.m01.CDS01 n=1 Tax=Anthostomella pinea TaxID=933095 RepID=A0AAI8VGV3_9PEZI|nr:Uu.00g087090.m01.CDS01 [Anthostomella pinea]